MKLKNFNNLLQEVILLKKKLFILEPQIEKSIEIIFRTLKKKKKFGYVEMVVPLLMLNTCQLNF